MSPRKLSSQGFTLVELLISMVLLAIIGITFLVFFKSALFDYLNLQTDASNFTELSSQEARVSSVIRGLTTINSASTSDLSVYAYFYPNDTYESLTHYYLLKSGKITKLMVDVTPMSANPPIGTLLTAQEKTYTLIDNFYTPSGSNLFTYFDSGGNQLTPPISNLDTVEAIRVNLGTSLSTSGNQSLQVQVSLRNRTTN
jgi:prepilin-type N-terminal cleavage/methylation domain-containing protein